MEIEIDPNNPDQVAWLERAGTINDIEVFPRGSILVARVRDLGASDQQKSTGQ